MEYEIPIQTKLENGILIIEGQAIDTTVNDRNWAIEEQDIPAFMDSLIGSVVQIRDTHKQSSIADVKGKVVSATRIGNSVQFRAEVMGDPALLQKLLEGCITDSSPGVIGADYICSGCRKPDRNEAKTAIVHMCKGAHEIVVKPKWIEQSLVPKGAYANNKFRVLGFKAGQDLSLKEAIQNKECQCVAGAEFGSCGNCGISQIAENLGITGTAQPLPVDRENGQDKTKMSVEQPKTETAQSLDVKALAKSIVEELNIDAKIAAATKPIEERIAAMKPTQPKAEPKGVGKIAEPVHETGPFGTEVPDYIGEMRVAASSKKAGVTGAEVVEEEAEDA